MALTWTNIDKGTSIGHGIFAEFRTNISSVADFLDSSGDLKRSLALPNNASAGQKYSRFNLRDSIYSDVETLDNRSTCVGYKGTYNVTVHTSCHNHASAANTSHCPSNYSGYLAQHYQTDRNTHKGNYNGTHYSSNDSNDYNYAS
jgi:hypothetical protein